MIKSLQIKNYALIEDLRIDFSNGLVIITGETGAGKSIIIDALGMVIGERASTEVVRTGSDKAVVEAVFHTSGNTRLAGVLQEHDLDVGNELIARREISLRGQHRCFLNDTPVSLSVLRQTGDLLVDLHGQHEHQSLLRSDTHIHMLDDFGGLGTLVESYQEKFREMQDLVAKRASLRQQEQQLREKREFIQFQINEIDAVNPEPDEEDRLEQELRILENSEKLFGATAQIYTTLYEGEQSVHDMLVVVRNHLQDLAHIDRQFDDAAAESTSAVAIVSELAKFIQHYNAGIEFNPERLEELRNRLGRISLLKKKYGGSLESIIGHRRTIGEEMELADNFNGVIGELSARIGTLRRECQTLAERLSSKRTAIAGKVEKAILAELAKLGIQHAKFSVRVWQTEGKNGVEPDSEDLPVVRHRNHPVVLDRRGFDHVEFYISTNLGEEEKPLAKVASGGEISRIMLALKSILAKSDRLPVLIFDEIDVGVSGRIAQDVGLSLKSLSNFHQVIAITHLPQIAGLADEHFSVFKEVTGSRTNTMLRKLTQDERIREVAKLMSGAEITVAGMDGARELMGLK
jgi:DNA repair protein RecN (Recombination protein N)